MEEMLGQAKEMTHTETIVNNRPTDKEVSVDVALRLLNFFSRNKNKELPYGTAFRIASVCSDLEVIGDVFQKEIVKISTDDGVDEEKLKELLETEVTVELSKILEKDIEFFDYTIADMMLFQELEIILEEPDDTVPGELRQIRE